MRTIPPPLSEVPAQPYQKRISFRGCLIAAAVAAVVLPLLAIVTIWGLATLHERSPKQPGEAELTSVVYSELVVYRGKEGMGNSERAETMARDFARSLRLGRHVFFTEGSKGLLSLTEGHFLTYCALTSNRCAFVVHVPQLRRYTPEAKVSLGELAWVLATEHVLATTNGNIRELAVAVRGAVDIDQILLGRVDRDHKPLDNISKKTGGYFEDEVLYPFFAWSTQPAVEHQKGM